MVPNNCLEYIWNIDKNELYCFENIVKQIELEVTGDRLFGIHLDSVYICKYNERDLKQWMTEMETISDLEERVQCCDAQLGSVLHIEQVHPFIRHAIQRMEEAKGKVAVEAIAAEAGYSPRHMERLFLQTFSYGPKRFCRYLRLLNTIVNMVQFPNQKIGYHIEHLGYSDQAHFQREFKAFMGMTPGQFMKRYLGMD